MISGATNVPVEFALAPVSAKAADLGCNVEVDVEFKGPDGAVLRVPAFPSGNGKFRVRFAAPLAGSYRWQSLCQHPKAGRLNGQTGELELTPYTGENPLYRRGAVRVAANRRYFEHQDGTPFFWLGDTWWMGLAQRLRWPRDFKTLTADRVAKGFSVIQIVAGLYPDMAWYDERGINEAGYPWAKDFSRLNPAYFDKADRRIRHLVEAGLMPCIVGGWGYFLPLMGLEKMKQHWRNLVARWGAYPVVWCLAGEGVMPYYLSQTKEADTQLQKKGWTELARYVHSIDPFRRPITIHPTSKGREQVEDPAVLDFDMLQTGHGDMNSAANNTQCIIGQVAQTPVMPVLVGEVCYEGIGDACGPRVQRYMFWASLLNGAAGHTYGANGIWQVNSRAEVYGPSPHGVSYGDTPWEDAYRLPGSTQLGLAKRVLERYPWWRFEPHPEWIGGARDQENHYLGDHCAGIPGQVRIVYTWNWALQEHKQLEPGVTWHAYFINPRDGSELELGPVTADANGNWKPNRNIPVYHDWVIVLEAKPGE